MAQIRRLAGALAHPLFLIFDAAGLFAWFVSVSLPPQWQPFFITLGSTLITIGITLPAAVYFQSIQNEQAFNILNACKRAGIESIFASRKQDAYNYDRGMEARTSNSNEIWMLGIAFCPFFDPSEESKLKIRTALNEPAKTLNVLILDPDCPAAAERNLVECGNATIDNIRHAVSNGLVATVIERIRLLQSRKPDFDFCAKGNRQDVVAMLNFGVRLYQSEPVAQVIKFDDALFCEQYHLGRPEQIVPIGSCIGKYMPVLEFKRGSYGYRFMESHFIHLWNESRDVSSSIVENALSLYPSVCRSARDNGGRA